MCRTITGEQRRRETKGEQRMVDWKGVFPAVTTQFRADQSLDIEATMAHVERLISSGCHGLIMLGTVGENVQLEAQEKRAVISATIKAAAGRVPVLSGVAETSTAMASRYAADCRSLGADGLMVLPGMVYKSDPRETIAHFRAVARAGELPAMIYNNPVSYGVDVTPSMLAELADEPMLVALKESSDDVRRVTDVINTVGDRYILFCGVDDLYLESTLLGVTGWVAGLVNAFPEETVKLYELAQAKRWEEARALYRWFMPLLHLDTSVKLVQYIKLAQSIAGLGSAMVRQPRLMLDGEERERVSEVVRQAIETRPKSTR
jgi:4-hydroxy-tetrahydrodipicolinate synthase